MLTRITQLAGLLWMTAALTSACGSSLAGRLSDADFKQRLAAQKELRQRPVSERLELVQELRSRGEGAIVGLVLLAADLDRSVARAAAEALLFGHSSEAVGRHLTERGVLSHFNAVFRLDARRYTLPAVRAFIASGRPRMIRPVARHIDSKDAAVAEAASQWVFSHPPAVIAEHIDPVDDALAVVLQGADRTRHRIALAVLAEMAAKGKHVDGRLHGPLVVGIVGADAETLAAWERAVEAMGPLAIRPALHALTLPSLASRGQKLLASVAFDKDGRFVGRHGAPGTAQFMAKAFANVTDLELLRRLSTARFKAVRQAVAAACVARGKGALPLLAKLVADGQPTVRTAAIGALQSVGGSKATKLIRSRIDDVDAGVRQVAIRALDGKRPMAGLAATLDVKLGFKRKRAILAICKQGNPAHIEVLARHVPREREHLRTVLDCMRTLDPSWYTHRAVPAAVRRYAERLVTFAAFNKKVMLHPVVTAHDYQRSLAAMMAMKRLDLAAIDVLRRDLKRAEEALRRASPATKRQGVVFLARRKKGRKAVAAAFKKIKGAAWREVAKMMARKRHVSATR